MPSFIWDIIESIVSRLMENCLSTAGEEMTARRIARNDRRDRVKAFRMTKDEILATENGRTTWRENRAKIRATIFSDFDRAEAEDLIAICRDAD